MSKNIVIEDFERQIQEQDSEVINHILLDMVRNQRESYRDLMRIFISTCVCFTIIIISMFAGIILYELQFEVSQETTTKEVVTTVEQEVSGSDSEINNFSGDMYRDNSVHNEE